ncbi:MAG: OmpA family protein, partial [Leptospiraceae bacterium]|nr:OmpA family protein [Leptospiraceae bacterium]
VVEKRSYPVPSPTDRKVDENGCQIYNKENFPPHAEGTEEGRFTLGVKGKRILFGYPLPIAGTHFIIQTNGLYASNTNHFGCKAEYILASGNEYEKTFYFHGIEIIQKLTPLTQGLEPSNQKEQTKYYKIEYQLHNQMEYPQNVNFALFMDTMLDTNDAAKFSINKKIISEGTKLAANEIPKSILVFQEAGNQNKLTGELILQTENSTPPSEVLLGDWLNFHKTLDSMNITKDNYSDSAVFLLWKEISLEPSNSKTLSANYGLYSKADVGLEHKYNTNLNKKPLEIFFDTKSSNLTAKEKMKLEEFIKNELKNVKLIGVTLEGYADIQGKEKNNFQLSQNRVLSVLNILKPKLMLKENFYLSKSFGSSKAVDTHQTRKEGNEKDRKVEINFFIE